MNESTQVITFLLRKLAVFLGSALLAYVLAVLSATGAVVVSLGSMDVAVPAGVAISMYGRDLAGMLSMFLPMIAFGLLVAYMATALLRRYLKVFPLVLYALAGATALLCIHLGLNAAFSITPIAVARSNMGLALQAMSGAAAGALYFHLSSRIQRSP